MQCFYAALGGFDKCTGSATEYSDLREFPKECITALVGSPACRENCCFAFNGLVHYLLGLVVCCVSEKQWGIYSALIQNKKLATKLAKRDNTEIPQFNGQSGWM